MCIINRVGVSWWDRSFTSIIYEIDRVSQGKVTNAYDMNITG